MSHVYRLKVRGFHCDFYGHVNNARYLEFLEEARWDYTEQTTDLARLKEKGLGFVVTAVTINYRRPAPMGMELEITSTMKAFGQRKAVMAQVITNQANGKIVADAEVTFAVIDLGTGRAVAMTDEVRSWFTEKSRPSEES